MIKHLAEKQLVVLTHQLLREMNKLVYRMVNLVLKCVRLDQNLAFQVVLNQDRRLEMVDEYNLMAYQQRLVNHHHQLLKQLLQLDSLIH